MVHVTFSYPSDDSDVTLHVKGYDSGIVSVESTSVQLDSSGNGTLVIQGVSVGSTQITVEDAIGGEDTADVDVVPPGVISTGSETQGAKYNANNMPGFTFSIGDPSLTPVTIDYNTLGSTLPSSLMGNLLAGSVIIDAGDTSKFVPFTVPDDGKIAPTRVAVVTLVVPGDTKPASKQMAVLNTDLPSIAIDGEQDGSDVDVDTDDDDSGSLATVGLNVSYDGTLNSTTFTWNPSQDVIWLIDQVGILGLNDLASLPGTTSDIYGDHHTWPGKPPADLFAQAVGGSPVVDGTSMELEANVSLAATPIVPAATTSPTKTAHDTQAGIAIGVSGYGMVTDPDPSVAGQVSVGAGVTVEVYYLGPDFGAGTQMSDIGWSIQGDSSDPRSATAIAGYSQSQSSGVVSVLTPLSLQQPSVHFYFLADENPSDIRNITVHATIGNTGYASAAASLGLSLQIPT